MKLEISKERVLEAASKCSTAKETLKTLFPEVFEEEDKYFDFSDTPALVLDPSINFPTGFSNASILIRKDGEYEDKGFFLNPYLRWEIKKDSENALVLIPTRK